MMLYRYRAAILQGQVHQGQAEALHELDLQTQLQRMGLVLLRARAAQRHGRGCKRLPRRQLIDFLFQLEMLLRAGVPVLSALEELRASSGTDAGRELSGGLHEKVRSGATLGEAMSGYVHVFPQTQVQLIRAGEVSGQLGEVLDGIVRSLKWQDELAAQTQRVLIYPSFVLTVIAAVIVFLMVYLVPQLVGFLNQMGQQLPLQTRLLMGLSDLFVNYGWALLLVAASGFAVVSALAAAFEGVRYRLHQIELSLPWVGPILKKMALARFADTLALMHRTGVALADSLDHCQKVSRNLVVQQAIRQARERVLNGSTLSESFGAEGLFPPMVIRMLKVGESTGELDQALGNISYFYTRDIDESVGKVQALIEPVLTVVMGLLLAWIMLAVLGPIYDTVAHIKL